MSGPWKGVKVRISISGVIIDVADEMTVSPHFEGGIEHSIGADVGIHIDGPKTCDVSITRKYKHSGSTETLFWRLFNERLEFDAYSEVQGIGVTSRLSASGVKMYDYERPVGGPGETVTESISGQARDWALGVAI